MFYKRKKEKIRGRKKKFNLHLTTIQASHARPRKPLVKMTIVYSFVAKRCHIRFLKGAGVSHKLAHALHMSIIFLFNLSKKLGVFISHGFNEKKHNKRPKKTLDLSYNL